MTSQHEETSGILSAGGDGGRGVDANGLGLVLLGGGGGRDSGVGDGLGGSGSGGGGGRSGLLSLLLDGGLGGLLGLLLSRGRSSVLLLGLHTVESLAGTTAKVAEHGLALVAVGRGGVSSLGLLNLVRGLSGGRNDGRSSLSGGRLLDLRGLDDRSLLLGRDNRSGSGGGSLGLHRLLLNGGRRAHATVPLVHEGQTRKEVLLLLVGSENLSLGGLRGGLSDLRLGSLSDRGDDGSLDGLGGCGLRKLRGSVGDGGILGGNLRLELGVLLGLLSLGRLEVAPSAGKLAEDAATLADLGLLLGLGLSGGKSLDGLILSGSSGGLNSRLS